MYGLPLNQSDQRIPSVFQSVYNNFQYNNVRTRSKTVAYKKDMHSRNQDLGFLLQGFLVYGNLLCAGNLMQPMCEKIVPVQKTDHITFDKIS